jgi:flagellar biosynthetic protein FlhB
MPEEPFEERTEPATQKRRTETREKGQVAKSMDVNSAGIFFLGVLTIYFLSSAILGDLTGMIRDGLSSAGSFGTADGDGVYVFLGLIDQGIMIIAPILGIFFLVALAINYGQVGFRITLEPLQPKFEKLNPVSGIRKLMFSARTLEELAKGIIKFAIVGYIVYSTIEGERDRILILADQPFPAIFVTLWSIIFRVALKAGLALIVLAVFDYAYQRHEFEKSIKMTKKEVKDELKHQEGDPKVKGKIRSIQIRMARQRMLRRVMEADVVVTNPIHLAVALKYDPETMPAPVVLAKGQRKLAKRIVELAKKHGIPVMENVPLAQALYRTTEVGAEIALDLYHAVAEVLAFVYRLKGKRLN